MPLVNSISVSVVFFPQSDLRASEKIAKLPWDLCKVLVGERLSLKTNNNFDIHLK